MTALSPSVPILESVAELADRYDAWLCDVWGVLHNGRHAFEAADDACRRYRRRGGTIVLLSNAPRPAASVVAQLDALGVARAAYDSVATSGDVTRALVRARQGEPMFHLGPERDRPIFDGLDVAFAAPDAARLVVCSGLFDDTRETPDDYAGMLSALKARDLLMICANPDIKVERGDELVYCAGALAKAYERLGGAVTYAGKPYPPVYELALRRVAEHRGGPAERRRVLAIGDGIETDIAGAGAMHLDALYVASGLHMEAGAARQGLDERRVATLFAGAAHRPVGVLDALKW